LVFRRREVRKPAPDVEAAPSCEDAAAEFPDTRYIRTPDDVYLACQTLGEGPIDLVLQIDWPGNIDMQWEFPVMRALLNHLAEFVRVILHDHCGIGLSSRNVPIPTLETRVFDLGLILEALDSDHPTLVGFAASGAVNALFAASRPERTASLARPGLPVSVGARYTRIGNDLPRICPATDRETTGTPPNRRGEESLVRRPSAVSRPGRGCS